MYRIKNILLSSVVLATLVLTPFVSLSKLNAQAYRGPILDVFRFDLEGDPGDSITEDFTITYDWQPNEDGTAKEYVLFTRALNFTQGEEAGIPLLIEPGTVEYDASLADWITFHQDSVTLNQYGQVEGVSFTIDIPESAEPGGKYAVVCLSNKEGDQSIEEFRETGTPGVAINSELCPLVFLTVSGEVSKNIDMTGIYTRNIKKDKTSFFTNPPVEVVTGFENNGNVHVVPRGVVTIHRGDDFTNPIASYQLNPTGAAILPGTSREYAISWGDNSEDLEGDDVKGKRSFILSKAIELHGDEESDVILEPGDTDYENYSFIKYKYITEYNWDHLSKVRIGKYTATVQYDYELIDGSASETVSASTDFTVFPWQLIIIIAIPVILLVLYLYYRFKNRD